MARSDEGSGSHSKKRPAEGDPDGAQPLAKRFGRLQLDVAPSSSSPARTKYHQTTTTTTTTTTPPSSSSSSSSHYSPDDSMILDDTKHTTYIHDLDRELADSESTPGALVLIPLAERMIALPDSVLADKDTSSQGKELVLYSDPTSLSVPKEQDSVRRAILESRARARAKKAQIQTEQPVVDSSVHTAHAHTAAQIPAQPPSYAVPDTNHFGNTSGFHDTTNFGDDDPMDIDGES